MGVNGYGLARRRRLGASLTICQFARAEIVMLTISAFPRRRYVGYRGLRRMRHGFRFRGLRSNTFGFNTFFCGNTHQIPPLGNGSRNFQTGVQPSTNGIRGRIGKKP